MKTSRSLSRRLARRKALDRRLDRLARLACRRSLDSRSLPVVRKKRHMDRCVRMIRHSDGIRDIAQKIKDKAVELINKFKQLSGGQKIALILTKIVKAVAAIYTAKTVNDIRKDIQLINGWKSQTMQLAEEWERKGIEESAGGLKRKIFLKQGLKALLGLITALVAFSKEKVIKAGLSGGNDVE